ncbi:hypothetical protein EV580_1331 [Mycobacterium sp. BK086]|uniref:helix-turn-helix transcriptional regulator n=1 Tax=Mycobacterium sp. BK086 TaxID=2512165 RepID=UPI0010601CE0|nr:hypothetical protein [Mycobacterium sp. BK086]TDO18149.1 hypothetical protein EV580_1331 [Mycobacterium sp. BK086]
MFEKSTSDARPDSEIHRCLSGEDCRGRVFADGQHQPALTSEPSSVCEACLYAFERAIDDMVETWLSLHVAIGDSGRRISQKVSGSPSAPINVNTDVDALKVSIVEWMVGAAAAVADTLNASAPKPTNNSDTEQIRTLVACTALIGPHVDTLLSLGDCEVSVWLGAAETDFPGESVEYQSEFGTVYIPNTVVDDYTGLQIAQHLTVLRRRARKLLALTSPGDKEWLSLPCPRCNASRSLTRRHEKQPGHKEIDQINCANCKLDWPYEQYRNLTLIWVRKDEMEREKLEKELAKTKARAELAEWLLAQREWQISLALDCPDVTAAEFAATILAAQNTPAPGEFMSDKDIAALVGVAPATVRSWAFRGHISKPITADDGSSLYLASEVYEYAKANTSTRSTTARRLDNDRRAAQASGDQ